MINRHAMYRSKAIVIGKMQYHNVKDERRVRCFYLVLGSKVEWNAVLPVLEFFVELADGI